MKLAPKSDIHYERKVFANCVPREHLIEGCNRATAIIPFAALHLKGKGVDYGYGDTAVYPGAVEQIFPGAIGIDLGCKKYPPCEKYPSGYRIEQRHLNERCFDEYDLDYVFSSHSLEHVDDWRLTLNYWISTLKPGGKLFLYLPHEVIAAWRPENTPHHKHKHTVEELVPWLREHGMKIIEYMVGCDSEGSFYILSEKLIPQKR